MRVIIVGAGIGGLTTAIALTRRGLDVEIYERTTQLAEVGAGVSLWPNALKALQQLGMKEALEAMSFVSEIGALRTSNGHFVSRTSATEFVRRFGFPTTVFHRAELLDALVRAAGNIPIHLGRQCRDFDQSGDRVTVHFTDGGQATGDTLVGADGLRSVVRERLGIPGALKYAGYTAWRSVASFATSDLIAGETFGCGQRFGLVPISGSRVYWYATDNLPEGGREAPPAAKERLLGRFRTWHAPIPDVIAATSPDAILRNDIYDRDPVDRWGEGRVTLVGDAAHPMTPNLGQGGCQAIEDGLVLARHLSGARDVPAALRAYESERIPRTSFIVTASRRVGQMGQIGSPIFCKLRDVALGMIPLSMTYRSLESVAGFEGHLDHIA
jgi:2-polyprenyl-6-methoxyphenol hydroxylase-like FAD-dependent oxidoreductase